MTGRARGCTLLCEELEALGVRTVFSLPGTQNVDVFEALRRSPLHTVVATSELAAGMMANGHARTSGETAVLLTIPGPGFAYALPALAEARLDSAPVLLLTGAPAEAPGAAFQLQALEQAAMASPVSKAVLRAASASDLAATLREAYSLTRTGEPGPVVVELSSEAGSQTASRSAPAATPQSSALDPRLVAQIAGEVASAPRVVIYAGQGVAGTSESLRQLAERLQAAVVTTTSARGALAEDHPLSVPFDPVGGGLGELNRLLDKCDLVLALGCKLGHNGSAGFKLRLPADRLAHVDAEPSVLGANYPARLTAVCDVPALVDALLASPAIAGGAVRPAPDLAAVRAAIAAGQTPGTPEPTLADLTPDGTAALVAALRSALPRDAVVVTDSGLHQYLVRRHYPVLAARGLLTPTDFQAMGFGLPAAIGAALAAPARRVVAVIGDGGLAVAPLELATAVREGIRLTVIVLSDGRYGLIRRQQLGAGGHSFGVDLPGTDLEALARAAGVRFVRLAGDVEAAVADALAGPGVTLVEARLDDESGSAAARRKGTVKALRDGTLRRLGLHA